MSPENTPTKAPIMHSPDIKHRNLSRGYALRLNVFARNFIPKSPTNNLSDTEHPPIQKIVEIFISDHQKIFPLRAQLSQHQQKPHQQPSNTEHLNPKKRAFFEICPRKKCLPLPGF
jgi:hypothetical protein